MSRPVGDCPKCNTRNSYTEKMCNMCGEVLPWAPATAVPPAQLSTQNTQPSVGNFKRCSSAAIDDEAKKALKDNSKKSGALFSGALLLSAPWLIIFGFVLLLVPIIGWIIGPMMILGGIIVLFGALIPGIIGFAKPVNQEQFSGLRHKYRNMMSGACPICNSAITIMPVEDAGTVACPSCKQILQFDQTTVKAK